MTGEGGGRPGSQKGGLCVCLLVLLPGVAEECIPLSSGTGKHLPASPGVIAWERVGLGVGARRGRPTPSTFFFGLLILSGLGSYIRKAKAFRQEQCVGLKNGAAFSGTEPL